MFGIWLFGSMALREGVHREWMQLFVPNGPRARRNLVTAHTQRQFGLRFMGD